MKPESRENILQEIAEAKQLIAHLRKKQEEAEITLQLLNERLFQYDKAKTHHTTDLSADPIPAAANISPEDKIALFRRLFRGREDVYPKLWQNQKTAKKGYSPACSNEWVRGVCEKPRIKCGDCPNQAFLPVSTDVVLSHLQGRHVIGVYPILRDETCWFLAADFDKESWQDDALAFAETCRNIDIPYAIERSRSGNGAHVWFFFSNPVSAATARKMGSYLITETMARRHQLSMAS